jgi:hypothetical protein
MLQHLVVVEAKQLILVVAMIKQLITIQNQHTKQNSVNTKK